MLAVKPMETSIDKNLTLQDRIRLFLNEQGSREVSVTIAELADYIDRPEPSVYQAVHILRQRNEIDVIKEPLDNGREKIVGIVINKLEPSGRTYKRAAERSGRIERIQPMLDSIVPSNDVFDIPNIRGYLEKKLAVEDMKARALAAGLDESVIAFDPDPMAEEAIVLLKNWADLRKEFETLKEQYQMQAFDLDAERRNVAALKRQLREDTDTMLSEYNES